MIYVQRVYDPSEAPTGSRFLVERLWPRGLRKGSLRLDGWLREVAPSAALRRWFNHSPAKWAEFEGRYRSELDTHPEACRPLLEAARRGDVALLYSARDTLHNSAVVLKRYLEERLARE